MLEVTGLSFAYEEVPVLRDISIKVGEGEAVCLIGANGAGKTTLSNVLAGVHRPGSGTIVFNGRRIERLPGHRVVDQGISLVPEGRRLFAQQTVRQNLELGAYHRPRSDDLETDFGIVFKLFPVLAERQDQLAATLSGGEQQMLAVGRALMARPRLLILDEPSMGLSPVLVSEVSRALSKLKEGGLSILLIEQNAELALRTTDRGYVMETGRIVLEARSEALRDNPVAKRIYLGADAIAADEHAVTPGRSTINSVPQWLVRSQRFEKPEGDEEHA